MMRKTHTNDDASCLAQSSASAVFLPSEAARKQVEALASYGVPESSIARVLGTDSDTLVEHYAEVLATAAVKANSLVAQSLFNRATRGDGPSATTAAIFWLKTRAGWRESNVHEITGPGGGPVQTMDVSVLSDDQLAALEPVLEKMALRETPSLERR